MSIKRKLLQQRERRSKRVHHKIRSVSDNPRLTVFRSLNHFYAQIIDDKEGKTLCACSTKELKTVTGDKKNQAKLVGSELAKRAVGKNIKEVAFDRGAFLYHGRVKSFADGAREGGLKF